jgi:hypothetical protein
MATVLVRVIVGLGRTRGRSGMTQCGQTDAQPDPEERRKTNLQEHCHGVQHSATGSYVIPKTNLLVAREHCDELLFASS